MLHRLSSTANSLENSTKTSVCFWMYSIYLAFLVFLGVVTGDQSARAFPNTPTQHRMPHTGHGASHSREILCLNERGGRGKGGQGCYTPRLLGGPASTVLHPSPPPPQKPPCRTMIATPSLLRWPATSIPFLSLSFVGAAPSSVGHLRLQARLWRSSAHRCSS